MKLMMMLNGAEARARDLAGEIESGPN